jgi:hypothetical protein
VLAYARSDGTERSLVILNFAATTRRLDVASLLGSGLAADPVLLASTSDVASRGRPGRVVALAPFSGAVLACP